jgi:hypothetical protein
VTSPGPNPSSTALAVGNSARVVVLFHKTYVKVENKMMTYCQFKHVNFDF